MFTGEVKEFTLYRLGRYSLAGGLELGGLLGGLEGLIG